MMGKKYNCVVVPENSNTTCWIMLNWIADHSVVLDVGCAGGYFGEALRRYKSCRCFGIEYDRERREEARALGVYEELTDDDLNYPDKCAFGKWKSKFDYIIIGDVLEHLADPLSVLSALKECVVPGGELLISLPNVAHASIKAGLMLNQFRYTEEGILDRTHLRFFTAENVAKFLSDAQLEIVDVKGTMLGIEGFTDGAAFDRLAPALLRHILQNVHSYICQYVCRTVPSQRTADELLRNNLQKLDLTFDSFPPVLRQYAGQMLQKFHCDGAASGGYRLVHRTFDDLVI